jgi:hypothetical protein
MAEQSLWTVNDILRGEAKSLDNEFGRKIDKLQHDVQAIAAELQAYNEQFETED